MNVPQTKFWLENPCVLISPQIFPVYGMTKAEKLNAITRLIIIISVILYFLEVKWWSTFFLAALLIVIILEYAPFSTQIFPPLEGFSITPTYISPDFQQTVVAPTFSEEWRIPPPAYDVYSNYSEPMQFDDRMNPMTFPYGQYLTPTNLLPQDEYYTRMMCSKRNAREFASSAFLRHRMAFQENMTRMHKKEQDRRFRSTGGDSYSPYYSF